jgi:hypothetical protein
MDHLIAVNSVLEKTRQFRHVMSADELREFDSLAGRLRVIEQSIMHILLMPTRRGPSLQAQCDAMGLMLLLIAFVLSCCGV